MREKEFEQQAGLTVGMIPAIIAKMSQTTPLWTELGGRIENAAAGEGRKSYLVQ